MSSADLIARLTNQKDRETYAALVSYANALPPSDEFRQLVDLLGLHSLLAQRIPDAVSDLLVELRSRGEVLAKHQKELDERLGTLPQKICASVQMEQIVREMGEAFRQQLAATGLQQTTALLKTSLDDVRGLSEEISGGLKSVVAEAKGVTDSIASELAKLQTAASRLQKFNDRLIIKAGNHRWIWQGLGAMVLFLLGVVCGGALFSNVTR